MWKVWLRFGLAGLKKRIVNMTPADILELDKKIDKALRIKEGSPQDVRTDKIVSTLFPILQEIVKHL
jgi:hypothetical protein